MEYVIGTAVVSTLYSLYSRTSSEKEIMKPELREEISSFDQNTLKKVERPKREIPKYEDDLTLLLRKRFEKINPPKASDE